MKSYLKTSYLYRRPRLWILIVLLLYVILTQCIPAWGEFYAGTLYPAIAAVLSAISSIFPFAVGDLFVVFAIAGLLLYPWLIGIRRKKKWRFVALVELEFLLWLYVWFYVAWGLNYSQKDFYGRTEIPQAEYTPEGFRSFAYGYIRKLNADYTEVKYFDEKLLNTEIVAGYNVIGEKFGINRPYRESPVKGEEGGARDREVRGTIRSLPRVKTMLLTPLASKVGVTGSMAPFFCEFTVNGDVPAYQYPATYAHEMSHLLGITSEAEANFYAYQVCIRSEVKAIRFSGYFSILPHVLSSARQLMGEKEYDALLGAIRPEVIDLYKRNRDYWEEKYSPTLGKLQDKIYDWYLKRNKIESGRKNYSEVIGLLISVAPLNPPKGGTLQ